MADVLMQKLAEIADQEDLSDSNINCSGTSDLKDSTDQTKETDEMNNHVKVDCQQQRATAQSSNDYLLMQRGASPQIGQADGGPVAAG